MINALLGEERVIAFDLPGTTRDAIEIPFERDGKQYTLVDTAGLRKRGKVFQAIEKFSVVKTLQAISEANVVLLLMDASRIFPSRTRILPVLCWKAAGRLSSASTSGMVSIRTSARRSNRKWNENSIFCRLPSSITFRP